MYRCQCGVEKPVLLPCLKSGTTSCGCFRDEVRGAASVTHGHTRGIKPTPEYISWAAMVARCKPVEDGGKPEYGGRGICVCDRWLMFENFLDDMGTKPSRSHSIERDDNDGNYEPGNCRWATKTEQMNNRRNNRNVTCNGETKTMQQWCNLSGINRKTLSQRLEAGWSPERAIWTPPGPNGRKNAKTDV